MKRTARWNPRMEFDPITTTPSGSVIWHDYGDPRRLIVTRKGENPRDVAARDREKHEQREREVAKRERDEARAAVKRERSTR